VRARGEDPQHEERQADEQLLEVRVDAHVLPSLLAVGQGHGIQEEQAEGQQGEGDQQDVPVEVVPSQLVKRERSARRRAAAPQGEVPHRRPSITRAATSALRRN
jgi:hypothetical protein